MAAPLLRRLIILVISLLSTGLALIGIGVSLNVAGFCYAEARFFETEEIIDKAIERTLALYPPRSEFGDAAIQNPIAYQNRQEFLRVNPDCCKIVPSFYVDATESDGRVPFKYSVFGTNAALVRMVYRVEQEPGVTRLSKAMPKGVKREHWRVTNCGGVGLIF